MRIACLLLIAITSISSGCSGFIASRGNDLTVLKTREEVRAVLGEPTVNGVEAETAFEEYRTRRKINTFMLKEGSGYGYGWLFAMTYGTSELILFPHELYLTSTRTLLGQTVRITYDPTGRVTGHYLDGQRLKVIGSRRAETTGDVEPVTPVVPPPPPTNAEW